jgi:putative (di)nucleoside polyphosphate hydrolase
LVDRESLPYRPCVGVVLINRDGRVWVGRRVDTAGAWQMPQGGIDPGETPLDAARRELLEETGARSVEPLAETAGWLRYDLPDDLLGKVWGGRYRGQEQKWFALRFLGDDSEINLAGHHREFDSWHWATADEVLAEIVPFKRQVYAAVFAEFAPYLR